MSKDWISQALLNARISQAELGRQLTVALKRSIDRAAVNKMTKGTRDISGDEMIEIAKITAYPLPAGAPPKPVRLVGHLMTGSVMRLFPEGSSSETLVRGYEGQAEKTVAILIQGGGLGPIFNGWLAYYDTVQPEVSADMIGQLCVVWLASGEILVKQVETGQATGKFTLTSNFEPPIYDVEITSAARIRHLQPAHSA